MPQSFKHLITWNKPLFALLLGAAAISFAPIFVRLSEIGPSATAFHRVFLAIPFLSIWMALSMSKKDLKTVPLSLKDYISLILSGVFFAADLALWHWSIRLTSVANATLLANAAPIFVTLGAFIFFGQKVSRLFICGLLSALTGIFLLMGDSMGLSKTRLVGDFLGISAAIFYAAYILAVGYLRSRFSTVTVMVWGGGVSCLCLVPITILSGESFFAVSIEGWLILLALALVSHVGGQGLIAYSLAHLSVSLGSVGLLIQPVLAATLAWIIFAESLGSVQLLGAIIVLLGIYIARRGSETS